MEKHKGHWTHILYFSKTERLGIFLLVLVLTLTLIFRIYLLYQPPTPLTIHIRPVNFNEEPHATHHSGPINTLKNQPKRFTPFDPNIADEKSLFTMPFTARQVKSILAFRNAGGKFRKKSDLKKIYSLDSVTFARAYPYLLLPEENTNSTSPASFHHDAKKPAIHPIPLNTADSAALDALPGIGPYLAGKIIRYRKRLGGFVSVHQLAEIPAIQPELLDKLLPYLIVSACDNCKINVNMSDAKTLGYHPYIGYPLGNRIFQYRLQHGNYQQWEDLLKVSGTNVEWLEKIKNHLTLD